MISTAPSYHVALRAYDGSIGSYAEATYSATDMLDKSRDKHDGTS